MPRGMIWQRNWLQQCREGGGVKIMKVRNSLRGLKARPGSIVVRRRGRTFVVNKKDPRQKARQG
jgi:large subunit ribosomal protein L36